MNLQPAVPVEDAPSHAIEFDHVSVSYHGKRVLADISFAAPEQKITAVIGPSGCGKSTLLHTVNRMCELVPGCDVTGQIRLPQAQSARETADVAALRRQVGLILQRPTPFQTTIRKNLSLVLREHFRVDRTAEQQVIQDVLTQVGLWDEVYERLDRPASQLSVGQQQRLCVARSLLLNPDILMFDEPCSSLDPVATARIEKLMTDLCQSMTLLLVTHDIQQAQRIADYVAVIGRVNGCGCVVEYGDAATVLKNPTHELTKSLVQQLN